MPETFRISVETAGPDCAAEGFPDQLGDAHGGRLVFRRENARHGPGHALHGASSVEPARSISGKRPKSTPGATLSATPSSRGGKSGAFQVKGAKRISHLGVASRSMGDGHSRKPFSSRALEGRNETHRQLISLGYGRLKPNPVGRQRLRSTIFPFGPPKNSRPRKVSYEMGPNSSRNKIASLRRPPLTLRPFAALRVQAARAGLLSAAPRDTSWRWASGPRRKTRRIFDNGHEPLQVRPQARNPQPRHLRDRRPALPTPRRRGKRRPGLRPHRPRIRSHPRPALDRSQAHGRGLRRLPQQQGDRHALPAHRRGPRLLRSWSRPLLLRKGQSGPRRHRPRRRRRRRRRTWDPDRP